VICPTNYNIISIGSLTYIAFLPGKRIPLKPPSLSTSKFEKFATFPHDPSVGNASSVLPKFHPGEAPLAQVFAVIFLNDPEHLIPVAYAMPSKAAKVKVFSIMINQDGADRNGRNSISLYM
jgi:hypothetical protein